MLPPLKGISNINLNSFLKELGDVADTHIFQILTPSFIDFFDFSKAKPKIRIKL